LQPSQSQWAPFSVEPRFVSRVWGFRDLRPWYDRVAADQPIGEVWLTGDQCVAATGPQQGKSLADLFRDSPQSLLGVNTPFTDSPLLIKVLFAREKLSVQVHPDDSLARKYGQPRGKTECWYALAAEPGAEVACGLKPGVTLDDVKAGIHAGALEESLNLIQVAAGDLILVNAGTVHAIWPGSILLEVQQNCDITYRLYDYGRPRELHIEKGLEATKLVTRSGNIPPRVLGDRTILVDTDYFRVERLHLTVSITREGLRQEGESAGLAFLFAAAGTGRITGPDFEPVDLSARGIIAVPAAAPGFIVEDLGGLDLIRVTPNWRSQPNPPDSIGAAS
jgi:mannose-6-phosphate isomerase